MDKIFYFIGIIFGIILFIIFLFIVIVIIISVLNDDVEEIDNKNGEIICGFTNKPCIKDKLYTKCNNCEGCPYNKD